MYTQLQVEKLKKSNEASKGLASEWEKLKSTLQSVFGPTSAMLTMFTGLLKGVNWKS